MDSTTPIKPLNEQIFSAIMGAVPVAYVRPIISGNATSYAVCTADGTQLAMFATQEAAFFAARQNDLEPTYTH